MASSVAALSPHSLSIFQQTLLRRSTTNISVLQFQLRRPRPQASRRTSNFFQGGEEILADDPRTWSRNRGGTVIGADYVGDEDDDEDEEEDRSLDLLIRFVENVFKKISKKARKAVRSVLPPNISSKLVGFSVNGVIVLAFLWVLKAFLEVVCTLGSIVFVSILLIRGIWTGILYLQERGYRRTDELDDEPDAWSGTQAIT